MAAPRKKQLPIRNAIASIARCLQLKPWLCAAAASVSRGTATIVYRFESV